MIPYVISIGHPHRKCPGVDQSFKFNKTLEEVKEVVLNKIYLHICRITDDEEITIELIKEIYNYEREEYNLDNYHWEAKAFVDSKWIDVTPTHEEIYNKFLLKNNKQNNEDDDEDEDEDDEIDEDEDEDEDEDKNNN